ncbi:hypothetical protein HUN58_01145 [Curtobacterium sp. Csp1]|uniref:hypothetical protein n=1 Tax=Curtobacterium sp. Csp1 TaxID=2495429 RepID=UPI001599AEF5|nr:hypothetical protein [Curtobacterium sp. Csp1]QKS18683.1 hypothetical protein HUN58_01145 [Curtobacterium sp. Csp1]
MTTSTKNVPVTETMTLRELAGAVGVAMGSAYAWSSKGKLPAGTYRDETGNCASPSPAPSRSSRNADPTSAGSTGTASNPSRTTSRPWTSRGSPRS